MQISKMKRIIQFMIVFMVLVSSTPLLLAQEDTIGRETSQEQWKWKEAYQPVSISLGYDTLTASPVSNNREDQPWWEIFGYEKLNTLVELAMAENYDLKAAENRVEESRAGVQWEKSLLYPSLSLNPSFIRQEFSANRPLPFDIPAQRIRNNTYVLPLDISYEVDLFGRIRNDVAASQFNWQAATALQKASGLSIAAEVARNFVWLLTLDSESEILERTIQTRQENLEIVRTRYQAGLTNEIDLQRAQTELSSVAVQLKNNQLQRTEIELALALLTGQSASEFAVEPAGIQYLAPLIRPRNQVGLSISRPDLQAATSSVGAFEKQLKSIQKERYPRLFLDGSAGLLAGQSEQIFEGDSRNWLVGATLSVPLFEGGRRNAQVALGRAQLERVNNQLKQQELNAHQEVEREMSNLLRLHEQLLSQQEFLTAAQRAAALSQQRYLKGLVTYLEVVDAQRIVLEAERLSIQLLGQQLLSTIDLMVALGGDVGTLEF